MTQKLTRKDFDAQMAVEKEMKQAMKTDGKPGMGKPLRSSGKPKGSRPITMGGNPFADVARAIKAVIRNFRKTEAQ